MAKHPAKAWARRPARRQQGFSLLELLVVMVIIGLLAGLVGPRLFSKVDESKQRTAEAQIKMLRGAMQTMRLDLGRFPTGANTLDLLYTAPTDEALARAWRGPYLDEPPPADPWGNPYRYSVPGSNGQPFALYSLGADGTVGGEGIDADLGYLP
ncbi:MAG: type II secretion system major pseudopilin GspG [Pseudomonadota bacterium]